MKGLEINGNRWLCSSETQHLRAFDSCTAWKKRVICRNLKVKRIFSSAPWNYGKTRLCYEALEKQYINTFNNLYHEIPSPSLLFCTGYLYPIPPLTGIVKWKCHLSDCVCAKSSWGRVPAMKIMTREVLTCCHICLRASGCTTCPLCAQSDFSLWFPSTKSPCVCSKYEQHEARDM